MNKLIKLFLLSLIVALTGCVSSPQFEKGYPFYMARGEYSKGQLLRVSGIVSTRVSDSILHVSTGEYSMFVYTDTGTGFNQRMIHGTVFKGLVQYLGTKSYTTVLGATRTAGMVRYVGVEKPRTISDISGEYRSDENLVALVLGN